MKHVVAFWRGVSEFRSSFTRSYDDNRNKSYDWGRELAHRVTLRRFEQ